MTIAARMLALAVAVLSFAGSALASTYFAGTATLIANNLYSSATGELVRTTGCSEPASGSPSILRIDSSGGPTIGLLTINGGTPCSVAGVYASYATLDAGTYAANLTRFDTGYYEDKTLSPFWIVRGAPTCPDANPLPANVVLSSTGPTFQGGTPIGTVTFSPLSSPQVCDLIGIFAYVDTTLVPASLLSVSVVGDGTVTSSLGEIDCGSTCSAGFGPGFTLTLSATPGSGSVFSGWSGDCSGTGPCTIPIDTSKSVTATFAGPGLFRAYLSQNGSDTNPCTLPAPCRLLPAALAAVKDGGEIWMLDSANFNVGVVDIAKSVTILAVPGALGSVVANNAMRSASTGPRALP